MRDVTDLEILDGDGAVVSREPRAEEGAPRCVHCGYPAIKLEEASSENEDDMTNNIPAVDRSVESGDGGDMLAAY